MKTWAIIAVLWAAPAAMMPASQTASLTSLNEIHALTNEQAARHVRVDFQATVTYYRSYEGTLFVQDGDVAIYVQPPSEMKLVPGDRVRIRGTTQPSFRPFVAPETITVLSHGAPLQPTPSNYDDLIHARMDCRLVSVKARVLAADIVLSSDRRSIKLQLAMDGGKGQAEIDSDDPQSLEGLLDAEVQISGAASGLFDGKMEMTGIVLHAQDMSQVKVLASPGSDPWTIPVTPIQDEIASYGEISRSQRIRVQGTITYYMPGAAVVLENGTRSVWVNTATRTDLRIGDQADATGFPDVHDGFLKLADGELRDSDLTAPVQPAEVGWRDLSQSHHVFDLVAIEGRVVETVREGGQDEYVLESDGHLFTAIYRHPPSTSLAATQLPEMKQIAPNSRVRVVGVCILEDSNPFNVNVPFDLLLRTFDDITVVKPPSPVTVTNLVRLVSVLLLVLLALSVWGWMMQNKARRQSSALAARIESEAALERRNAQIEHRRSRILEDINGSRPLAQVLEEITELVSFMLNGAQCWCEVADGARLGRYHPDGHGYRVVREEIPARSGPALGAVCALLEPDSLPAEQEAQALFLGTRVAALAIETHRAYSDLVHRSEFDLLTDIHNRFSLDKQMEALIARARASAGIFGLIYVDLDNFKQVNDVYGHHTGDLYLQEVAARMKRQLRSGDLLARLGGDEFAVLVPAPHSRADVQEIAARLEHCFDEPFLAGAHLLSGSASVGIAMYPEDGTTKDSLLSTADAAMYVTKHMRP
ncbi:MAG TPA: GGDEF domain-containing protein [Terracidiphilus sp.]|nr:GGDEF domain-containing protein [Terracidiphilus sp.]